MKRLNFSGLFTPVDFTRAEEAVRTAERLRDHAEDQQRRAEEVARRVDAVATLTALLHDVRPEQTEGDL